MLCQLLELRYLQYTLVVYSMSTYVSNCNKQPYNSTTIDGLTANPHLLVYLQLVKALIKMTLSNTCFTVLLLYSQPWTTSMMEAFCVSSVWTKGYRQRLQLQSTCCVTYSWAWPAFPCYSIDSWSIDRASVAAVGKEHRESALSAA